MNGLEIVAYKYQNKKVCPKCFIEITPPNQTIQFSVVYYAVQILSQLKYCENCGKILVEDK